MNKERLMIFLSVMVVAAMLLSSFAMIPSSGQGKASASALQAANIGVPVVPGAPRNLVADQGPDFVWLFWDHPATNGDQLIKTYQIWRGVSSGAETLLDTIFVGATNYPSPFYMGIWLNGLNFYNDTTASIGPTYFYQIVAVSDSGSSLPSNEASATPDTIGSAPDAPIIAGEGFTYSAQVNWTEATVPAGSPPARFYYLFREGGFMATFPLKAAFGASSYTDIASFFGAQLGKLNNYSVMAANTYGLGTPAQLGLYVRGTGPLPSAPLNLSGYGGNHTSWLVWAPPIDPSLTGFDIYDIYRADSVGGTFRMINQTSAVFFGYSGLFFEEGLTNGTTYQYKVRANNSIEGVGPFSNVLDITPHEIILPLVVDGLNAYPGDSKILLVWDYAYNATNYSIWRSESSGTESLLTTIGNEESYLDTTAINGHTYFYKVKPISTARVGPFSPEASATASTGSPTIAPVLVATPTEDGVYLYSPPIPVTNPIIGWKIYREGVNIANESTIQFDMDFTWTDDTALVDKNYNYTIKAENLFGLSAASNVANSFKSPTGDVPDPITTISAIGGAGGIVVSWSRPTYEGTAFLTYYDIQRNNTVGGWTSIKDFTDIEATSQYTDHDVIAGVTYSYRILAFNLYGDASAFSPVESAAATSVTQVPSAPQNLVAQSGAGFVKLTWQAPSNMGTPALTGYKVYRGTASGGEVLLTTVTALTYNDTTGTVGTPYWYYVKAENSAGLSPVSNEVSGTSTALPSVPGAPQSVVAVGHNGYVLLNWLAPSVAGTPAFTKYSIFRGANAGSVTLLANVTAPTLSYNDSAVTNGQTYVYAVKAVNTVGASVASNIATATPSVTGTAPGAPTGVTANGLKNKISLTWTAPANPGSGISNYLVYRATTAGGQGTTPLAKVTGTTYMDTTATPGTPYFYVVKANNTYGASPASNEANATAAAATAPTAPQSLTATAGPNKVTLTWTAPTDDGGAAILGYKVYRSSAGGAYAQIGSNLPASTLSYVDTTGTVGTTYSYYVVAFNSVGAGAQSTVKTAAPESGGTTDNTMLYAGIGAAIVIVVIIIVAFWFMKSKKTPPKTPPQSPPRSP